MRRVRTSDSDPAPGLAELPFHILLALAMVRRTVTRLASGSGGIRWTAGIRRTGALYQALRRLTEEGLVTPVAGPDDVIRGGCNSLSPGSAAALSRRRRNAWPLSSALRGSVGCIRTGRDMRVYRWLVRLCPEALRREYGAAMEETMANRLARCARRGAMARVESVVARERRSRGPCDHGAMG